MAGFELQAVWMITEQRPADAEVAYRLDAKVYPSRTRRPALSGRGEAAFPCHADSDSVDDGPRRPRAEKSRLRVGGLAGRKPG